MIIATLVQRAARWLRNTKKCGVVITEWRGGPSETPDAFGWKSGGCLSYLVEVKASRADFFKDQKKWFRVCPEYGIGTSRYYFTLPGLIHPSELPERWGLLELHGNRVRVIVDGEEKFQADREKFERFEMMLAYSVMRTHQANRRTK